MKTKLKTTSRRSRYFLLLILAAVFTLGAHLYSVAGSNTYTESFIQLSRIDFENEVDSLAANRIKGAILQLPGVQHTYFNVADGIVVYSHDPRIISAQEVFDTIESEFQLPASRYIVDAQQVASSCPITGTNSIFVRAGRVLRSIFP